MKSARGMVVVLMALLVGLLSTQDVHATEMTAEPAKVAAKPTKPMGKQPLAVGQTGARAAQAVRLAEAGIAASCQLVEIHATTEKKGIDPKLVRLKAKLTKPPFSAWDTFKLLAEPIVVAEKDKPAQAKLATGGTITLLLKDKVVSQGGKPRLRVGIDVDDKAGKRTLSTVMVFGAGDVHFPIAGAPHDKGVYIAGLSCALK